MFRNDDPEDGQSCWNNGLVVAAKGIGLGRVLAQMARLHADPHSLTIIINTSTAEFVKLAHLNPLQSNHLNSQQFNHLNSQHCNHLNSLQSKHLNSLQSNHPNPLQSSHPNSLQSNHPNLLQSSHPNSHLCDHLNAQQCIKYMHLVTNETPAKQRAALYMGGGVMCVTSRILIVDILNCVVPLHLLTGIIVNHAHQIHPASIDAFILRLYRQENKVGFIRAFSDEPASLASGIGTLERAMKCLMLKNLYPWPRFHQKVIDSLSATSTVKLVELRVSLSKSMKMIQAGLVECLNQCLLEIKRCNSGMDFDELNLENTFYLNFDGLLRKQLEFSRNATSARTKQIARDISTLRRLLGYLVSYDCVTFFSFLETIRAANSLNAKSVFKQDFIASPWLMVDAAHVVFEQAKRRVYKLSDPKNYKSANIVNLEEQPKWRVLLQILNEIEQDRSKILNCQSLDCDAIGLNILIMTNGERTCRQIKAIISKRSAPVAPSKFSSSGTETMLTKLFKKYQCG